MQIQRRGRVAKWTREQLDELSTPDLRALLENAERLKETGIAVLCSEILDARPRGRPAARRHVPKGVRRLVTRGKAFEMHGVALANPVRSRGGLRADGSVVLIVRADEVEKKDAESSSRLWAPESADAAGGQERLEHCRIALERGAAEGLLLYGKGAAGVAQRAEARLDRIDPETLLALRVEKRGEEYWATWTAQRRVVRDFE